MSHSPIFLIYSTLKASRSSYLSFKGRQSTSTSEYQSFQLLVLQVLASTVISAFGTPGIRRFSVISAFGTPSTR